MGCDIHMLIERRDDQGRWHMWTQVFGEAARERNYKRFAALAGVRGDGPDAKGLPIDLSEDAAFAKENGYALGEHSFSWLPLAEAATIFDATDWNDKKYQRWMRDAYHYFNVSDEDLAPWRLVFGFDS